MTDNTKTLYNALDRIKELEKEKCELLGLIQAKDNLIEKMKCCSNCKYSDPNTQEPSYSQEPCFSCTSTDNKWELAE